MRLFFPTNPLLLFFFFLFSSCRGSTGTSSNFATSSPPSVAPSPCPSSGSRPAGVTVEEACHLMVVSNQSNRPLYPFCVAALRSKPAETRNATIHRLAVLAAELVQRDVVIAVGRMQVMESRGAGGDQEELDKCLIGYSEFIALMQGFIGPLRRGGYVGMQKELLDDLDYVDCRWMKRNPVKEQQEILALVQTVYAICNKYCSDSKSRACSF